MFTLAQYDGRTWTQTVGNGRLVNREDLPYERWPLTPNYLSQVLGDPASTYSLPELRRELRPGYDIARHAPASAKSANFGGSRLLVRQRILSMVPNTGYLPVLPSVTALRISETSRRSAVRVRPDSSIDIGVLRAEDGARVLSELSPQVEYGLKGQPPELASARPNPAARLSERERVQYLQLPTALPVRVRAWAQTIAAPNRYPGESHYRRARRLMVAVQQSAVYTLRPPITPDNRDATEFFLFESRRGYCTYFAGALTVACRAVGIPARVVTGFTNPEWQANGTEAILREANAHAWTEIWVPNWGWAALDATPADDRGDNAPSWVENWQDIFSSTQATLLQWVRDNRGVVMAVSTLLLLALAGFGIKARRGALQQFLGAHSGHRAAQQADATARRGIFVLYHKLSRKLSRRFRPASPWETPLEWVGEAQSVLQLRDASPLGRLTELYTRAKYSPHPLSDEDLVAARAAWQHLSWERQPVEKPDNAPTRRMR
jgi:transglutaminase-like putative cysteine protease